MTSTPPDQEDFFAMNKEERSMLKRLEQLAIKDPKEAAKNPIWKQLHLKDANFLKRVSGHLKLFLLALTAAEEWEELRDTLTWSNKISVDIFEIDSCKYTDKKCTLDTTHMDGVEIDFEGMTIDLFCHDTSAQMIDIDQCEERLLLVDAIIAFHENRDQNLQNLARSCDIDYYPSLSPDDGCPMRPGGIRIHSGSIDYDEEIEAEDFPDDTAMIMRLKEEDGDFIDSEMADSIQKRRPLFSSAPSWDEECGLNGKISVKWNCDCYVPVSTDRDHCRYKKHSINQKFDFHGNDTLEDYVINYRYAKAGDLEEVLSMEFAGNDVSKWIEPLLLKLLGLST